MTKISLGKILQGEIKTRSITIDQFSKLTGLSIEVISKIYRDEMPIDTNVSSIISRVIGTTPFFWANLSSLILKENEKSSIHSDSKHYGTNWDLCPRCYDMQQEPSSFSNERAELLQSSLSKTTQRL